MIPEFKLDTKLESDSFVITNLDLSQVRLVNNSDYPWLILVPRKNSIFEITDLSLNEYNQLQGEIRTISQIMLEIFKPDKLNIATIGNVVRQLHVHIIARFKDDKLFPKPVWGCEFTPYLLHDLEFRRSTIINAIKNCKVDFL